MAMDNEILKTYEILEKIGEGSGGTVYKAYHKRLGMLVVLKRITNPKKTIEENKREVNILKNLNHSYLPHVIDFLETDAGVFTVMSYVPGKSFQQILREGDAFTKEDLLKWAMQICNALHYLHTQPKPIIHGDIKPSNIMLMPQGDICIIDFNISTFLDERTVYGCTRGYTSPEQFWAVSNRMKTGRTTYRLDEKTDIYSVGATLYHMATGSVRRNYEHAIDIELLASRVGWDFAAVIQKATSNDPNQRYQSAYEMYMALKAIPEGGRKQVKAKAKSRAAVAAIIAAVVLGVVGIGGGVLAFLHHQMNVYDDLVEHQVQCLKDSDYEGEANYYRDAVDKKPKEPEAYYWHADSDYLRGDYDGCIGKVDDAVGVVKESTDSEHMGKKDLYALKGAALLAKNNADDDSRAVEAFREAEHCAELTADQKRQYATALARTGDYAEATEKLDEADQEDGSTPQSENTRGEIAKAKGNNSEAAKHYETCIAKLKDKGDRTMDEESLLTNTYVSEANMYKKAGDTRKAMAVLKDADNNVNRDGRAIVNRMMGVWAHDAGNTSEAIGCFQTVIKLDQATKDDYEILGECYIEQNNPNMVRQTAEQRKEKFFSGKEDFYYYRLMAMAEYLELNRTQDATKFNAFYEGAARQNDASTQAAFENLQEARDEVINKGY